MSSATKDEKLDMIRMKDINSQLIDIIYFLCNARKIDSEILIKQLTNMSLPELESLYKTK